VNMLDAMVARRSARRWTGRLATFVDRHFLALASLPAMGIVAAVTVVPFIAALGLSFTNYSLAYPDRIRFVGLETYVSVVEDGQFSDILANTLYFAVGAVVVETVLGVALALALARPLRFIGAARAIYTIPLMTANVAAAVAWKALLNQNSGWITAATGFLGLPAVDWLGDPTTAMPALIVADAWTGIPIVAVLVLAGLLSMPTEPSEAALVDGASPFQIFLHVTLPAIKPVLVVCIVFRTVEAFRQFGLIQIMTGAGPGIKTMVLNYYVYQQSFSYGHAAYGAALAVLLVLMLGGCLGLILAVGRWRSD